MFYHLVISSLLLGLCGAALLLARSFIAFSQAGPKIRDEVIRQYRWYSLYALLRLGFFSFLIISWMGMTGGATYYSLSAIFGFDVVWVGFLISGIIWIVFLSLFQFTKNLLYIPSGIMMSSNYKMSRFYPLWFNLSVTKIRWVMLITLSLLILVYAMSLLRLYELGENERIKQLVFSLLIVSIPYLYAITPSVIYLRRNNITAPHDEMPNVLMIGCDTLRLDRLGSMGYARNLTPFIDSLCQQGSLFSNCYTPVARTAPSLATIYTGLWPFSHGVRDNFVSDEESELGKVPVPKIFSDHGYETLAISDWSGSDLKKLRLGFERYDLPPDQWNLKYLIRQGAKDIRLFLSLFLHNKLGKRFLPEIYYLAGTPLTKELGESARKSIRKFSKHEKPFFINIFMATAHPPFGSEYPYYTMFSPRDYLGESKFAMARLVDPFDVIRSMREPREAFELDQVIDLYDSCARRFDDEVRRIVHYLDACGVRDNTIIVIYSDHGMELFEHDTWGQGNSAVGEASPKIPLVVVDPRLHGNGINDRVVRTVDIAPTLLELCGINSINEFDGVSLVPYMKDSTRDSNLAAYFETGIWLAKPPGQPDTHLAYPDLLDLLYVPDRKSGTLAIKDDYSEIIVRARDRMVRLGEWKLVRFPLRDRVVYQLYNLTSDPGCCNDVSNENPAVVQNLMKIMSEYMRNDGVSDSLSCNIGFKALH